MENKIWNEPQACNTKNRAWTFTWNNYTDDDISYLEKKLDCGEYVFGEEIGEKGTPHLQGVVRFKNARSFNSMRNLFKNNHIEICKNWIGSKIYCSKDGETYTNIQNHKILVEEEWEVMLEKEYGNVIWKNWQQYIIDIIRMEPDTRTIHWIWDECGNIGKSFLCKYLDLKHNAIIASGKSENVKNQVLDWMNRKNRKFMEHPKLVVLDIPRSCKDYINYGILEDLKNGHIYSGKYEGGKCIFSSPHVIVFANRQPERSAMSQDRWNVVKICEDGTLKRGFENTGVFIDET